MKRFQPYFVYSGIVRGLLSKRGRAVWGRRLIWLQSCFLLLGHGTLLALPSTFRFAPVSKPLHLEFSLSGMLFPSLYKASFFPPSFRGLFKYLLRDTFPDSQLECLPPSVTLSVCLRVCLFYWRIVNFQCCVSFRCTAKWFSYTYTYLFFGFFSIIGYVYLFLLRVFLRLWNYLPWLLAWLFSLHQAPSAKGAFLLIHHRITSAWNTICNFVVAL